MLFSRAMSSATGRLPSLDGMRGLSILLVVLGHLVSTPQPYPLSILYYTGEIGSFGVKVFFVISGFLITELLLREKGKTGRLSLKKFYLRRVRRIFPAFYIFLLAMWMLNRTHVLHVPLADFLHAATFTANIPPMGWDLLHIWSLSVEEQFYLLWPALLIILGARWSIRLMAALTMLSPLVFAFSLHAHVRLGQAMSGLAAGCVLAGWRSAFHESTRYMRFLENRWSAILLALSLFTMESLRRFSFYELLAPLISVVIALLLDCVITVPESSVGRVLNWRPLIYVGGLSYSLYLWQQIFLNHWGSNWFNVFPVNLVCSFALALASFYLVERPFLRRRNMPSVMGLNTRHAVATK